MLNLSTAYKKKLAEWNASDPRTIESIGTRAEFVVAETLIPLDNLFCFHHLPGAIGESRFEIDLLVVSPLDQIFILEVKAYSGRFIADKDPFYLQKITRDGQKQLKNPVPQVKRTARLFRSFLTSNGYDIPVMPVVVVTGRFLMSPTIVDAFENETEVIFSTPEHLPLLLGKYTGKLFEYKTKTFELIEFITQAVGDPILFPTSLLP